MRPHLHHTRRDLPKAAVAAPVCAPSYPLSAPLAPSQHLPLPGTPPEQPHLFQSLLQPRLRYWETVQTEYCHRG